MRLTTTALLWIIFVAYLFVRRYGGPGSSRLAAGLALFGAADVPLIYISVSIWRTIHPKTSVVPTLDRGMRPAFWLSMLLFSTLFFVLLSMRRRLERARKQLNTLYLDADEAGLLDDQPRLPMPTLTLKKLRSHALCRSPCSLASLRRL